jgi:hypothetical protein
MLLMSGISVFSLSLYWKYRHTLVVPGKVKQVLLLISCILSTIGAAACAFILVYVVATGHWS